MHGLKWTNKTKGLVYVLIFPVGCGQKVVAMFGTNLLCIWNIYFICKDFSTHSFSS